MRTKAVHPCVGGRCGGFTLVEAMMASAVLGLFVMACATAVVADQVAVRKAKERAIAMDFISHYAENIKALPFAYITHNYSINTLYDGVGGAPSILIPGTNNTWVSINNTNYEIFDPDLLWIANRNPKLQVNLNTNSVGGAAEIDVNIRVQWDAPLSKGPREEVQLDLLRTSAL